MTSRPYCLWSPTSPSLTLSHVSVNCLQTAAGTQQQLGLLHVCHGADWWRSFSASHTTLLKMLVPTCGTCCFGAVKRGAEGNPCPRAHRGHKLVTCTSTLYSTPQSTAWGMLRGKNLTLSPVGPFFGCLRACMRLLARGRQQVLWCIPPIPALPWGRRQQRM